MGRSLQPLVSWIAVNLLVLSLLPGVGTAAPPASYQFRPLPGEDSGSRQRGDSNGYNLDPGYPGVGTPIRQPRYRFREQPGRRLPRYAMPGYRSQPEPEKGGAANTGLIRPPATARPIPGYRFRPGGKRAQDSRNR